MSWKHDLLPRVGPWALLGVTTCAATVLLLVGGPGQAIGYAEVNTSVLRTSEAGVLVALAVQPGQTVRAGQPVATLENSAIDRAIEVVEARLTRAKADTVRRGVSAGVDTADHASRLAKAKAELASLRAEQAGLKSEVQAETNRAERGLVGVSRLQGLTTELDRLTAAIAGQLQTVRRHEQAIEGAMHHEQLLLADDSEVRVLEAERRALQGRRDALVVRATVDGVVSQTLVAPGDHLEAGAMLTEVSAATTQRAVVCLDGPASAEVRVGAPVALTSRMDRQQRQGTVSALATSLEAYPQRCRTLHNVNGVGRAVYVRLEQGAVPGEVFDVGLAQGPGGAASLLSMVSARVGASW